MPSSLTTFAFILSRNNTGNTQDRPNKHYSISGKYPYNMRQREQL